MQTIWDNEERFNTLMRKVLQGETEGMPLGPDNPIEQELSRLELQANMDGYTYRTQLKPIHFELFLMTEEEFAAFRRLLTSGGMSP